MKLVVRLSVLAAMLFGTLCVQAFCDDRDLHWPWYFIHQVLLAGLPMAWLLAEVLPSASAGTRLAFVATSSAFIALSSICELLAIENRYWWFDTSRDIFIGVNIGAIPVEEFLFYPLFLNLPILFYLSLAKLVPPTAPRELGAGTKKVLRILAGVLGVAGLGLIVHAMRTDAPPLDYSLLPAPDAAGADRYSTGPADHGWTIVQALGLAGTLSLLASFAHRVDRRRFALTVLVYFVFTFFVELMACGRGWWVWNERQVLGVFTWVLPIESYAMYLTGAMMPVLVYLWWEPFFATGTAAQPAPALKPSP